jgi:hypothetical protein
LIFFFVLSCQCRQTRLPHQGMRKQKFRERTSHARHAEIIRSALRKRDEMLLATCGNAKTDALMLGHSALRLKADR